MIAPAGGKRAKATGWRGGAETVCMHAMWPYPFAQLFVFIRFAYSVRAPGRGMSAEGWPALITGIKPAASPLFRICPTSLQSRPNLSRKSIKTRRKTWSKILCQINLWFQLMWSFCYQDRRSKFLCKMIHV